MKPTTGQSVDLSIRRHLRIGTAAAGFLVLGLGGWAFNTEISGAVLAPGSVVVDAHVKKVQHPTGGVIGEIHVRNGDRVKAGDVVIRLDQTVARANLAVVTTGIDALVVRKARLEAERDGANRITLPVRASRRSGDRSLADVLQSEVNLFKSRREAREGLKSQFQERLAQIQEQIEGLELQAVAKADEIKLIQDELVGVSDLYEKKLVPITRVMPLRREETSIRGEHGQLLAEIAQAKGRISETKLQLIQIDQDLRAEVTKELREVENQIAELSEREIKARDELGRIDIRAPYDGVVHELAVHTIGGVIGPGDPLMLIVPEKDDLSIEVRIAAQDRDQIYQGQLATLRLSAFNQRTTPEVKGTVSVVGADLVTDAQSRTQYYPARIAILPGELERLGTSKLAPGMPVESFIQTGYRTVLSYLTKPLWDYIARAFRSE